MKITVKTYLGRGHNPHQVWVNGVMLDPKASLQIVNHSPDGFMWGYYGSGPAQTALAICLHLFGPYIAEEVYHRFKEQYVSCWKRYVDGEYEIDLLEFYRNEIEGPVLEIAHNRFRENVLDRLLFTCSEDPHAVSQLRQSESSVKDGRVTIAMEEYSRRLEEVCETCNISYVCFDERWTASVRFAPTEFFRQLQATAKKNLQPQ